MSITTIKQLRLPRGYLVALASAVVLSTTAIFIRYLTETYRIPALVLASLRGGIVVLTLTLFLRLRNPSLLRVEQQHRVYLAIFGFILAVFNALWTLSVSLNGAAIATVLAYSSAGFTVLLGWLLLNEAITWRKLVAVAFSFGGCVLVSGALGGEVIGLNPLDIFIGVLAGLFYAGYSLMGRAASQRGLNPWSTLLHTFGYATGFLFLFNLLPGDVLPGTAQRMADFLWLGGSIVGWGLLITLAAGPTLGGFGLYNVSLSHIPSSVANLIVTTEPVFTATFAYLILGERMTNIQVIGSLMILMGVVILTVRPGSQIEVGEC